MPAPRHICLLASLLLTGCYDSSFSEQAPHTPPPAVNYTLSQLKNELVGEEMFIRGDVVVRGRVTTCDRSENFYRTLFIQDEGASLEVMAGLNHLHNSYPEGTTLTLRLQGLKLCKSRGTLQVGRPPLAGSGYRVDYLASAPASLDKILFRPTSPPEKIAPVSLSVAELHEGLCGTLVRVSGVHFSPLPPSEGEQTDRTWVGNKRFEDAEGRCIYTFVRRYARFARQEIPDGECSLTGILQYDNIEGVTCFSIKPRDEYDCQTQTLRSATVGAPSAVM